LEGFSKDMLDLQLVFDPPWTLEMMSQETRIELGMDE
jgi:metal-sulfur cluster biosynthetic enzyme